MTDTGLSDPTPARHPYDRLQGDRRRWPEMIVWWVVISLMSILGLAALSGVVGAPPVLLVAAVRALWPRAS